MGAVYTATSHLERLREGPSAAERAGLMDRYYHPLHRRLTETVDACLARFGSALVIDCHSFPGTPLPYEKNQDRDRPNICIGLEAFHAPGWLLDTAASAFRRHGLSVAFNKPFDGAMVPGRHYRTTPQVHAVMIEVNRRLYMDERTGDKLPDFARIAGIVRDALAPIHAAYARTAGEPRPARR